MSNVIATYRKRTRRKTYATAALWLIAVAAFLWATVSGPYEMSAVDTLSTVFRPGTADDTMRTVVWNLRLPASVMAVLIGASLALSGAHMQTILDNPLAEPFTLGISAAAAFGGAAAIVLGWSILPNAQFNLAAVAWVASLVAVAIVASASMRRGTGTQEMILLGIALVFLFQALLSLMQYRATTEALQQIVFWTMGSLQRATWTANAMIGAALLIAVPYTVLNARKLNVISLGADVSTNLGVNHKAHTIYTLVLVSLLMATTTALVGPMTFLGFLVATLAYQFADTYDHRYIFPMAVGLAFLVLIAAYFLMQHVFSAQGVVSIIIELVGGSVFLFVIMRKGRL